METNKDKWRTASGQRIFETEGKLFLILQDAVEYTGIKRGAMLHQIESDKVPKEDYIQEEKYTFITLNYLEKIKDHSNRIKKFIHLEEKYHVIFNDQDIDEFVKWKIDADKKKLKPIKRKKPVSKGKK